MSYFVKILKLPSLENEAEADPVVATLPEVFATEKEAVDHAEECLRSDLYPAASHTYDVIDGRGDSVLSRENRSA